MNCAIELNQQRERLNRFVREAWAGGLTLIKSPSLHKRSAGIYREQVRREVEVLKDQVREMEFTVYHPEALSWLQHAVNALEVRSEQRMSDASRNGFKRIK